MAAHFSDKEISVALIFLILLFYGPSLFLLFIFSLVFKCFVLLLLLKDIVQFLHVS